MTCVEYERILTDVARGFADEAAAGHASECAACQRYLSNQRELTQGLSNLAARENYTPSTELELTLLAHFKPVRRRPFAKVLGLAAAAAIAAACILFLNKPRPRVAPPAIPRPVFSQAVPVRTVAAAPIRKRKPVRRRARNTPSENPEPFILIPYAAPLQPTERAEIVRVNMPVSALTTLGIPIIGADPNFRLNADLVLGENGLARAVRVLH